jgi:hypothetical protein
MTSAAQAVYALLYPRAGSALPAQASEEPTLQMLVARTQALSVDDAVALGFFSRPVFDSGTIEIRARDGSGLPDGQLTLNLSPARTHRALMWSSGSDPWCRLWLDGREIDVPRGGDGRPLTRYPGLWADEALFTIEVSIEDHPRQDFRPPPGHGIQRGLLLVDAASDRMQFERPHDDELWRSPWLRPAGSGRWELLADSDARDAKVARVLTWPPPAVTR